ncbi:hypothetical protein Egran_07021, partial [Elaphomyces granulatus]
MLAFIHRLGQKLPYIIHTPDPYCAPEILVHKEIDLDNPFAADLWSAGCAIFHIATGVVPVDDYGINLLRVWSLVLRETLPHAWIKALPQCEQHVFTHRVHNPNSLTLDGLVAEFYHYPDKQDFADFLRLILVMRPEKRANIPTLLRQ